jgi:DNA-binding transcriptional MerR regulator
VTAKIYKLDELARAAGMTARTVRYYVQRGLLPAPAFRGKDTAYEPEHLLRLRAIRRLQAAYFPLDAIAAELDGRTAGEIERIADGTSLPAAPVAPLGAPAELAERHAPRRTELLPGVELVVARDAPERSVRLVAQLLEVLDAMSAAREGGRRS